jgi:hypothetical protein
MTYQFIKSLSGVPIYKGNGKYYFVESQDSDHNDELSGSFDTIEECEKAVVNMLESNLF